MFIYLYIQKLAIRCFNAQLLLRRDANQSQTLHSFGLPATAREDALRCDLIWILFGSHSNYSKLLNSYGPSLPFFLAESNVFLSAVDGVKNLITLAMGMYKNTMYEEAYMIINTIEPPPDECWDTRRMATTRWQMDAIEKVRTENLVIQFTFLNVPLVG